MKKEEILKMASCLEARVANPLNVLSLGDIYKSMEKEATAAIDDEELNNLIDTILDSLENFNV